MAAFRARECWKINLETADTSFTVEGVSLYKLLLYKVPRCLTEEDVRRHFSRYAKVKKVELLPDLQAGYVQYAKPLAAGRAIADHEQKRAARRELRKPSAIEQNNDWNFYLDDDGIVHTEDGVVVYNIFIYNVPRDVTAEYVQSYFCEFGRVRKVQLLPDQQAGYVHFADPLAAARALEKQEHTLSLLGKRCNVEACHSWHQPPATSGTAAESSENVAKQSGTMTLLDFNDECLLHIFRWLKLREQIHFALTHSRLLAVFEIYSNKEFRIFDLDELDPLTLPQQRELFRLVGNRMKAIELRDDWHKGNKWKPSIELMCRWCTYVKSITVFKDMRGMQIQRYILSPLLFNLVEKMQQITELRLVNLSLEDYAILEISKLPNLRTLLLAMNRDLTGRYLDRLRTVQQLNLSDCLGLKAPFVRDALIALTQLTSLKLSEYRGNITDMFKEITGGCSKLEELEIDNYTDNVFDFVVPSLKKLVLKRTVTRYEWKFLNLVQLPKHKNLECLELWGPFIICKKDAVHLAQLTQLRILVCCAISGLDDDCLYEFSKLKCLEELDVSINDALTNEGVDYVLRGCTKLRKLNLSRCTEITEGLLHRAIRSLQKSYWKRSVLVEIDVRGTAIRKSIVEADAKYKTAASAWNLLKMHCDSEVLELSEDSESSIELDF